MSYIGKTPTAVPLTSSDITDGIVSNSKLAQDIISAETELATAPADTDELLISDAGVLKRIDASLIGGGGITEADTWRLTTSFSGSASPIASNWERADDSTAGYLGSGMTQSSGIFTFPSTGIWRVSFDFAIYSNNSSGDDRAPVGQIEISSDSGGSYDGVAQSYCFVTTISGGYTHNTGVCFAMIDVTNASTFRAKFRATLQNSNTTVFGQSDQNNTAVEFIRLGDT